MMPAPVRLSFIFAAVLSMTSAAQAQSLSFGGDTANQPLTIEAQNGIEWLRDTRTYVARGNAKVNRGDLAIRADILTARYRETPAEQTEIYQIEAEGRVVLMSPSQTARGEKLLYNMDQAYITLHGGPVEFKTIGQVLTANESLSYWPDKQTAIAKGRARVNRAGRVLTADTLTALFEDAGDGNVTLKQAFAEGDVQIQTDGETAFGDTGQYDTRTDTATLTGDVRLVRGDDQLRGAHAEVDFGTGISRLLARKGSGRVQGIFTPKPQPKPQKE